ncbi:TFIIA-domain-containing protein [Setomelanomma holmii]|uniref:TFIIA-domain-containing protein n=1 Tax=Setomelanomma holmii TaxID=210430 RepID=A0A9P4H927_9PLEO|nr:TFIIA-domain-containing protein [Setomelanomma holmii]
MSNQIVGTVYEQIIAKVVQASQNDFEEFGVDQSTLDEMKQVCDCLAAARLCCASTAPLFPAFALFVQTVLLSSAFRDDVATLPGLGVEGAAESGAGLPAGFAEKLSALKVAQFPWDPQPEPVRQPPTVPSNVKSENDLPPVSAPQESLNFPNVPIKTEGGYQPPISSYPQAQANGGSYNGGYDQNQNIASQRAAALVQQRMQQSNNFTNLPPQGRQPMMPMQGQMPQQGQQQHMMAQQQQRLPQQVPQQRPPPQQGHLQYSQNDGTGDALADWEALKAARAAALQDEAGRLAADDFMRARVDAMAMRQDSGLMVPLESMPKGKKRKAAARVLQAEDAEASSTAPGPARFDGEDDEVKEDPEDAINSDLDDPEDELNDGDNSDDEMVDYMLCTYDKVQRVKNKWKCTLKDGILTTNKKEYLFHKANGEFEW